ncbi:sorbitol dehydrogenase-like [Athalia rosae]|uniref:sorbitol dehydrogenase-like n=1 Tax=Athalia rosae TaxID=37344 RepID=UPI0020341939|nr:sorbitol dehydrogenase-like [Athalia rosae]XP_012263938.2 sorbitol dehydrogenase-like [Athalia rosae]XP_020710731.2 sorbitol dehydrogenase-like [Athalia rosae]
MEFLDFDAKTKSLTLRKGPIPVPAPDEVLVKVAYSGICGTDLHIIEGSFPCKQDGSVTLGHEFSGVIEAIGSEVTSFKVGQKVVVDPNSGCNICDFCHGGNYHFCLRGGIHKTIGIYRNGGWATHAVAPETQVYLVPDEVDLDQAALVEPLSCLAHGWDIINPVNVGSRILVIGAGIIGSLWSSLLHLHGQRKTVTVSEPQIKRRELFENLNLDFKAVSPAELKGREFDLAIDCSGSGPAIESAIPLLGKGGRLCIFGVASPQTEVKIKPFEVYMKELSIVGVNINPFTFPKALHLATAMTDTYLNYKRLGIGVYSLAQYKEALAALKNGEISKAVFKL